ncbi:MAG TPA: non-canonical purine NTP diphosphatase [Bacteroidales bacterium]|nr:non-canonical purine NTP diphosphatase [Bacteroidales bacterium]HOK75165.1 non-canonical purine NTP diphosphatase [Bacteroidales bacterium]HOM40398.1 non-canonical purine NTP diphosphatase [Bacteroidales bacterium]HPP93398.1 non-canonical purine NTP diphosphatase [Bacteroidales bacterium]HRR16369.1 non-canonical purine NTP diphosphatase [Bacteroidales bacterium]
MRLVFATNNKHKIREISELLGDNIELLSLEDVNIHCEIPEDYNTLEENAMAKARYIHKITGMDVFADDTGLEIDALNGAPGVFSARFAGEEKDFEKNIDKVLELMKDAENRKAAFRTVIALIKNEREYLFEGKVNGTILRERRGTGGFGYDPIFLPDGYTQTFAEMTLNQKNMISHRAIAFRKLKSFLLQNNSCDNKNN